MGIRGLTTFIARRSEKYLEHYELHNTYLVLDGNNIASHLYKWHCVRNDCFGGDYDKYAKVIRDFFTLLNNCNVVPIVFFDGGYENKKLRTVYSRLKNKLDSAKHMNSVTQGSLTMFPLFTRDLFVDIVLSLELKVVRCSFEADYEMACLARNLNCPVLSYDSDFYVFDVLYIPFSSFDMTLRKTKNSNSNCIHCSLYKIENFLNGYGGMSKSNLPLLATLLGNDYIKRSVFNKFFNHIKMPKRKHLLSDQQRTIIGVIKWLQNESYDSAVKKVLGRLKMKDRKRVAEQIRVIAEGYVCKNSKFLEYLNIQVADHNIEGALNSCEPSKILQELDAELENDGTADEEDDTSSCTSEDSSEASEMNVITIEVQSEVDSQGVPAYFLEKFQKCDYPPSFMDILNRNIYLCTPQVEDYSNVCSHHISAPILAVLNRILSSGKVETLTYVARSENSKLFKYATPVCDLKLPTLQDIKDISVNSARTILLETLNVGFEDVKFLDRLPESWQLYILGIIFWVKNAKPKVTYSHVYSVVLCMLALSKIDLEIGFCRSSAKFFNKFENQLHSLSAPAEEVSNNLTDEFSLVSLLNKISYNECLLCMRQLIKYFQMDEKMRTHLKLFNVHVVDCFAQLQSCLLHIKYLNLLLNQPFENLVISDFYNGTFVYMMCCNLMKRNDVDAYLDLLFSSCASNFLNCFKIIVGMLVKVLLKDLNVKECGRRRRKKKKSKADGDVIDKNSYSQDETDEEDVVDVNNRFSLLKLVR